MYAYTKSEKFSILFSCFIFSISIKFLHKKQHKKGGGRVQQTHVGIFIAHTKHPCTNEEKR